jgi:hypothetical protein
MLKFVADVGYVNTMDAPTASGKQQRVLRRASTGSVCATMPGRDSRQAEQLQKVDEPEQPLTRISTDRESPNAGVAYLIHLTREFGSDRY